MVAAFLIAPFMGIDKKGGFQYIQEYTGFVSPGILAMFVMGFFWQRTTSAAAMFATIGGFLLSVLLKFLPAYMDLSGLAPIGFAVPNAEGVYEMPFMDRMMVVFLAVLLGMAIISLLWPRREAHPEESVDPAMFRVSPGFMAGSAVIFVILTAIYWVWF
jgi:SSS family solute:Na+ symporter